VSCPQWKGGERWLRWGRITLSRIVSAAAFWRDLVWLLEVLLSVGLFPREEKKSMGCYRIRVRTLVVVAMD
jgi:hypothetical protein